MRQSGPRIAVIDGLRGIAILLVIYQHVYSVALRDVVSKNFGVFPWVIGHGWMGVSLFFILSGFVLALPFFVAPGQMTTVSSALHFYARRSKRLLPLFFFMAFVSFAVAVHSNPGAFRSLVLTLSTASMFTTREFFPSINAPFWSLALEIWFSVLFPILLIAVVRTSTMAIAISIGTIALAVRVVGTDFPFINSNVNPVKDSVPARLDDFVVGMALARLYATNRLPQLRSYHALLGIACIALAGALWDLAPSLPRVMVSLFNVVVQGGVALVLIAALNSKTRVATLLSIWPLRVLGAMCFSLYCWHALLISPGLAADPITFKNQLAYLVPLLVLSAATYRYIEYPRASFEEIFRLQKSAPQTTAALVRLQPSN